MKHDLKNNKKLSLEDYIFSSEEHAQSKYEEETGTRESDPEINSRINDFFMRQRKETQNPAFELAGAIKRTYETAKMNREYISACELRTMARKLKSLGVEVPAYSNLKSARLYRIIEEISERILRE